VDTVQQVSPSCLIVEPGLPHDAVMYSSLLAHSVRSFQSYVFRSTTQRSSLLPWSSSLKRGGQILAAVSVVAENDGTSLRKCLKLNVWLWA